MSTGSMSVLVVGLREADVRGLRGDDALDIRVVGDLRDDATTSADALVLALDDAGPLEAVRNARALAPDAAIVIVTSTARAADGAIAVHAGAEDHLVLDDGFPLLLPKAVRYAVTIRQLRRDLATVDEVTGLPNLRGFAPIAEHQLRLADRGSRPVVFVFLRLDDFERLRREGGLGEADALARDAASVLLDAIRDADVPARISLDTLVVLLTGNAVGAESQVLSRLVEAMAVHDAAREAPRSLSLSVGTARYDPATGGSLAEVLEGATRGLATRS